MEKSFKLKNHSTFKNSIEKLLKDTSITKLEQKAELSKGTLNKYLNGKTKNLSSKNIEKILIAFNWNPSNVGIIEIMNTKFSTRLKTLLKENNMDQQTLAEELGISAGNLSNLINGENEPSFTLAKSIAQKFNVHYLYLLGEIDTRNASISIVNEITGLQDEAIKNISSCVNTKIYGQKLDETVYNDFGFRYTDIINFIAKDLQLFDMFYFEVARTMSYHADENFRNDFNRLFNTVELDLTSAELGIDENIIFGSCEYDTLYKVSIETFSKSILCEKIKRMFDEFIDKKLKEKNIVKK